MSAQEDFIINLLNQASSVLEESSVTTGDEDNGSDSLSWKSKRKHFFVLSEAGKPIYTRSDCCHSK